ncbi:MAG: hypothetical protein HKN67_14300 [Saprospiraceae bacterium]|nr:hypothetical protein [Bacteroidia bacterium]MBT8229626.1 hypothetical protein [Bacteroidia bacterium]NNF23107.1 hypothetical protein [Saprospiraceae bacterium]NNK89927.1 hypothetical protein [Saprospiraceae bacterium]
MNRDNSVTNYEDHRIAMVIADLYLTGQILEDVPDSIRDSLRIVYREQLSTIHKVDMDLMEQDIEIVQGKPSRYVSVHKIVRDSIAAYEARYKLRK